MNKNIPLSFFLCIFSIIVNISAKAQNLDSIFSLKDYERTVTIGDIYKNALQLNTADKAKKIQTAVNKNGTPAEKLLLEKIDKDVVLWKNEDKEKHLLLNNEYIKKFKLLNNHLLIASTYMAIATYYEEKGLHNQTLENHMYAFDELAKDPEGKYYRQVWFLHQIASSYYRFNDYEKAIQIATITETLGTRFSVNSDWFVIINPNLAGMAYLRNGNYDSARIWLQKTYNRAIEMKNNMWLGIAGGNIGSTFYMQKKYSDAIPYFTSAVDTCTNYKLWDNVSPFCTNLADCYMHLGKTKEAASFLEKAKNSTQLNPINENWLKYYNISASYYKLAGNSSLAFQFDDSVKLYESKLTAEFDIAKKVRTEASWAYSKSQLETEVALQKAKKERWILYSIIASAALLSVIGILFYKRQKLRFLLKQEYLENEKLKIEETLEIAKIQMNDFRENIQQKNELIERFTGEIEKLKEQNNTITDDQLLSVQSLKQTAILTEEDWSNFKKIFETVYPGYLNDLKNKHEGLTPAETRYIMFVKLGLSPKEMAATLGVSAEAIRNIRFRVKKKLDLNDAKELEDII